MEDGREASTATGTSKKKDREHYQNPDREIDQQHLAHLLRSSANLVEQGEFGSILYEALQDFRVYYKQKYPKTGKKKKVKKEKSERATDPERTTDPSVQPITSTRTTSEASEKPASVSSEILEDLKQSEEKDLKESEDTAARLTDEEEKKLEPDGDTKNTLELSGRSVGTSESNTDDPEANVDSNLDTSMKSESKSAKVEETIAPSASEEASDVNEAKTSIPVAVPVGLYKANVYGAPTAQETTAPEPNIQHAVPMPSAEQEQYSAAATPSAIRSPFKSPSTPQTQNKSGGFGKKFKLGATLQNVKKGALNVKKKAKNVTENITKNIDKKHHGNTRTASGAREDLEFYAETGVTMAVSSNRRTTADADSKTKQNNNGKKEFVGSSESKSRVTPGSMAGSTTVAGAGSRSRATRDEENGENFVDGDNKNQFSHDNHGRPESDRNLHSTVPNTPVGHQQPPVYKSYSGETSDNADSYDSGGDPIPDNSEASTSFELPADPIVMESDTKPRFLRPSNTNSPLVVSGWIEQFRRSKMRHVWKEVLFSLVEGRKPGEVTTLWIQREIVNPSGQKELEALQRIPLKILEEITFTENSTDYQFRLKIYNGTEDLVFRCNESATDALRWVQTIKKYELLAKRTMDNSEKKTSSESTNPFEQQQAPSTKGMPVRELRAICNGAGVNTAGMERVELENAAEEVQRRGTYFDQRGVATGPSAAHASQPQPQLQQQYPHATHVNGDPGHSRNPPPSATESAPTQQEQQQRMGIKELRAICHGAGVNTVGMERRELEAAANEVQSRGTYFNPPIGMQAPNEDDAARARQSELRRQQQHQQQQQQEQQQQQKHEELMRRKAVERHRHEVEEARKRAAFAEQEARRRAAEEEARRRAIEEDQRRRAAEEEARRRAAAEEQLRRQQEAQAAQTRYAQQQAAWQQQKQAEEQRRRAAEQQAAAERRRRDEALRKEQEWATPAPGARPQQQQPHQYHQQQRQQGYPQQQWQQQQQQPQHRPAPQQHHQQQARHHTAPPPQQQQQRQQAPPQPPSQQQQQRQHSGADNKYAQMANQSGDNGQATITKIKHSILIQWALQPPQLQMLRPIAGLVTTIHNVFPPALGVSGHDYFKKWKPITREDVAGSNNLPEESKLKKSVRKIRFFLHPDKLPHDLNEEQKFTVKMLWDITNDSWEEYQKNKEDLDWVN